MPKKWVGWINNELKKEWDEILRYVYNNGSVEYEELVAKFSFDIGVLMEKAEKWLMTLFKYKLLERKGSKGQEVTLTKKGYQYISQKIIAEMKRKREKEVIVSVKHSGEEKSEKDGGEDSERN